MRIWDVCEDVIAMSTLYLILQQMCGTQTQSHLDRLPKNIGA